MSLHALAASPHVQAAARALLHFVWQGSVIAALLWLALASLPGARASLRYGLSCLALALLALCPPATFWVLLVQHSALAQLAPPLRAARAGVGRHGVEPALLAIVTLVESLGDPQAESPRGARGLMQLMPDTAAKIASERQLPAHSDERLFEPEYNLDLGAWFLARQLAAFGNGTTDERSVELAATAYNCGPTLAREILAGSAALPAETARYRELIVGMWNEREQPESPTFSAWQARLKASERTVRQ